MRFRNIILLLFFAGFMAACSNINLPEIQNTESEDVLITDSNSTFSVSYDAKRDIAVFVDENNEVLDIISFDEESGKTIKCTKPIDMAILEKNDSVQAIVVGVREDNKPGVWLIGTRGTVTCPVNDRTGKRTTALVYAEDVQSLIDVERKAFLGWVYTPILISDDGCMIAGYAYNEEGFSSSRLNIDPGSKVAVYWKLTENSDGFYFLSKVQVVGTFSEREEGKEHFWGWLCSLVSKLKLLFLNHLDDYLKVPDNITAVANSPFYQISGLNKEDKQAIATVDYNKVLSIEVVISENQAPVASFANADYIVLEGGSFEANGLYKQNGTTGNILDGPLYEKISGSYYSIYQYANSSYEAAWAIHSSVVNDLTDQENVFYYIESPASFPPVSRWAAGVGISPAPEVREYPVHVDNSDGYVVSAFYEYFDPDGDQEGDTIYTWYSSIDGQTEWTLVEEGTNRSFQTGTDLGFVKVIITPVDSLGVEGASLESASIDLGSSLR